MKSILCLWPLGLASMTLVGAQQFSDYSYDWESLNLTEPCFSAVNSTVSSCPSFLARYTTGFVHFLVYPNDNLLSKSLKFFLVVPLQWI